MINKVILIGNMGADAEVRTLESGVKVARVRLATSERVKRGEEWVDHTEWHSVVFWRNLADVIDKYTGKGSRIYIEGTLRYGEYEDKEGRTQRKVEIVASDLKLLDRKADNKQEDKGATPAETPAPLPSLKEQQEAKETAERAKTYKEQFLPDEADELPF